jgi:glycosyltransferase involved in cell wall biosynthesis
MAESFIRKWRAELPRIVQQLREWLFFDSRVFRTAFAIAGTLVGRFLGTVGRRQQASVVLSALHRSGFSKTADRAAEHIIRSDWTGAPPGPNHPGLAYIKNMEPAANTKAFFSDPQRLLGKRMLVIKSPSENERGVLVIDYTGLLPVVARFFDFQRVCERYYVVLEPGWTGYCDPAILCAGAFPFTFFIETYEPRDLDFMRKVNGNFVIVPLSSGNSWVDYRIFRPLPDVAKTSDLIMVAAWAHYKRHARFFDAVARLRKAGRSLKVTLVGYPSGLTRQDIFETAAKYGVQDQVTIFEWLSLDDVNEQLNRSRINMLWSRKEGFNRAIIEGMFAGIPCIMREGFNYGYKYPYINKATGRFATEETLPAVISAMLDSYDQFSPRDWVMANMSCDVSTATLGASIRRHALSRGEKWTSDLKVHVSTLNSLRYWDEASDRQRFEEDYRYLGSLLRMNDAARS